MSLKGDLASAFASVAKSWLQEKHTAHKGKIARHRLDRMRYSPPRVTIREVAFEVMEAAYMKGIGRWALPGKQAANFLRGTAGHLEPNWGIGTRFAIFYANTARRLHGEIQPAVEG